MSDDPLMVLNGAAAVVTLVCAMEASGWKKKDELEERITGCLVAISWCSLAVLNLAWLAVRVAKAAAL
jgi:hypothetical protein